MTCSAKWRCNWGIAIVSAAFLVNFIRDGIRLSFGMFFAVFLETFGKDAETTAWIGSLMLSVMNFSAPLCSLLVTKFGSRFCTVLGSLLCFLGFLFSAYIPNLYFLYFSLGCLTGLGISLMFLAQTVIVVKYFKANRSLAMGVSVAGSGIGGIFFTFLMTVLSSEYAWSGIMLILSGIMLEASVAGMLMRPKQPRVVTTNIFNTVKHKGVEDSENVKTLLANEQDTIQSTIKDEYSLSQLTERCKDCDDVNKCASSPLPKKTTERMPDTACTVNDALLEAPLDKSDFSAKTKLGNIRSDENETIWAVYKALLKDRKVYLFVLSQFCVAVGYMLPFMFIPISAMTMGYSKTMAAWLMTGASIASTCSRLAIGVLGDRKFVNRTYLFTSMLCLLTLTCLALAFSRSYALLLVLCCLYGMGSGALVILIPVVATDIFGDSRISEVFGLTMFGRGPGNLIAPPVAGYIIDQTGSTTFVFILGACAYFCSSIVTAWCVYIHKKETRTTTIT